MSLNIPLRVRNLVERHDTSDPYRIAKELNCIVILAVLPPTVNGFWKRILRRRAIFINENLPEWQQAAVHYGATCEPLSLLAQRGRFFY